MKVRTSEPFLWAILFLLYAGTNGQVTIMPDAVGPYTVGDTLTLSCMRDLSANVTGRTVEYLWQCNGCFAHNTTDMNVLRQLTDTDSSMISCSVFIDDIMNGTSMLFDLQVTEAPIPIVSFDQSSPIQGIVGSPLTIECRVETTVPGVSNVSISWTGPTGPIMNNTRMIISPTTSTGNIFTSVLSFTYLMERADDGSYTCEWMILTTNGSESVELQARIPTPTVSVTNTNTQTVGQSLTLQCAVTTVRGITSRVDIVWSSNGAVLRRRNSVTVPPMDNTPVYMDTYNTPPLNTSDHDRVIQCEVVINATQPVNASNTITLNVMVPTPNVSVTAPNTQTVGQSLTLQCEVTTVRGITSRVDIVWSSGGIELQRMDNVTLSTMGDSLTYTDTYNISQLNTTNDGEMIQCEIVINTIPSVTARDIIMLDVIVPTPNVSVTAPDNQTVGRSLTLQCEVTTVRGITSEVDIVWSSDGMPLNRTNGTTPAEVSDSLVYTDSYTISPLSTDDEDRVIQCEVVINGPLVMVSNDITLDVSVAVPKPSVDQSTDRPNAGSAHNLTCTFELPDGVSSELLKIDWSEHPSLNNSRGMMSNLTHVGSQYTKSVTFEHIGIEDNGNYTCTVNIVGFASNFDVTIVNVNVIVVSEDSDSSSAGAIAGGVVGALVAVAIILLVVVLFVLWYRRREPAEGGSSEEAHKRSRKSTSSENSLSSKHGLMGGKNGTSIANSPSDIPMEPIDDGVKKRMEPIALDKFSNYVQEMHKDRDFGFETEYATISDQPLYGCDAAKTSSNNFKNRYVNINPYDYSRVKLIGVSGKGKDTDYINASYIDGYQKPNAYIAAQGPLPETVKDFWQMIWDYKLRTIVMLTKPVEAGTAKCEVYWPEKVNETLALKPTLHVRTTYMQYFADFDMRTFEVTDPSEPSDVPLEVSHFFFTSWPDHGVPQFATALISFIKKVRKHYSSNGPPMVVHCSAGVGRSGTYITLDTMLQRMPHTNNVNAYEFVHNMRMKRVFMVQTLAQYIFVHDALEELITCGDTSFNVQDMLSRMGKLSNEISEKGITGFDQQFDLLQKVSRQFTEGDCSDALTQYNISKNRHNNAVPYNSSRVQMKATPLPGSDYINASFVDGYKHRNAFIATQCPMENTVNDFWRMMWESQSAVIVMLCSEEHDAQDFYKFWPDEEAQYGKIKVTQKSKSERNSYNGYKFTVLGESVKSIPLQVTMLHYTDWAPLKAPGNTKALLGVTKELVEVQRHTGNKGITVMCSDGCGRTGSFITIYYTLERVKAEQTVDIFQAIKNSRIRRTGLVSNTEQYQHCHNAVTEFLDEFSAYSNFI